MNASRTGRWAVLILIAGIQTLSAQSTTNAWRYRLLEGSLLLDDNPLSDRIPIPHPIRGTFDLLPVHDAADQIRYALTNIHFHSSRYGGEPIDLTGDGDYTSDPAHKEWAVQLRIHVSDSPSSFVFGVDLGQPAVVRKWPIFQVSLVETQAATETQVFYLTMLAAPVRDLWFSTASGMTPGNIDPIAEKLRSDDYLSVDGRRLRRGEDLASSVGVPIASLADAIAPGPEGAVWFSLREDADSTTLGPIYHGDLLSETGARVRSCHELIGPFGLMPPVPDVGLDAVQLRPDWASGGGATLFSTTMPVFSEGLGRLLGIGDLLAVTVAGQAQVVKSAQELIAAFHPKTPEEDPGVDAFYVWPSGEVWFSTENAFETANGTVMPGDLLSDEGYVAYRNRELVSVFSPLEELADFGLDALHVVTDADAADGEAPRLTTALEGSPTGWRLRWSGAGRAFQVEKASNLNEAFQPVSGVTPDLEWTDTEAAASTGAAFYRVRQW